MEEQIKMPKIKINGTEVEADIQTIKELLKQDKKQEEKTTEEPTTEPKKRFCRECKKELPKSDKAGRNFRLKYCSRRCGIDYNNKIRAKWFKQPKKIAEKKEVEVQKERTTKAKNFKEEHIKYLTDRMRWVNQRASYITKTVPTLNYAQARTQAIQEWDQKQPNKINKVKFDEEGQLGLNKHELNALEFLTKGISIHITKEDYRIIRSNRSWDNFLMIVFQKEKQIKTTLNITKEGHFKLKNGQLNYE